MGKLSPKDLWAVSLAFNLALSIALPLLAGIFVGRYIGSRFDNEAFFIFVGVLLGMAVGFFQAARLLLKKR